MTRLRPRSVRGRAVLSAGLAVLAGSVLVSVAAVAAVSSATTRALDESLATSLTDVVAQVSDEPLGAHGAIDLPTLDARDPAIVQVVDRSGRVVASTHRLPGGVRICPSGVPEGAAVTTQLDAPHATGTFRVLQETVTLHGRDLLVCAARSEEQAATTEAALLRVLAVVVPAITLLVCVLVWRQVGRALTAVSRLSQEADHLRTLDSGRLGVPGTGDEVEELAVTLNTLLDRLHDQASATRRFVADAGHELRTPLTSLRLALELAADHDDDRPWVDEAHQDVDRLATLVDDLLVLARADGGAPTRLERVDLPALLLGEVDLARRLRPEVSVDVEGGPVTLTTDPRGVRRAVGNLLSNAVHHAVSRVVLSVREHERQVVIDVVDDGPGVPADEVERIFERFVRLDDARDRDAGGSGLGLAIVAAFAEQCGGSVTASPGPGGRFHLVLPLDPVEGGRPAPRTTS